MVTFPSKNVIVLWPVSGYTPILINERWAWSWSQCTGSQPAGDFLSHSPRSKLPLLPAKPAVTFRAKERHRPSTSTKLYCLVTETHRCKQLAQRCYVALSWWEVNPWVIDRKSNALLLFHCAIQRSGECWKVPSRYGIMSVIPEYCLVKNVCLVLWCGIFA